ncbi:F-box/WD repeat-containing protein 8-like [Liolophura sinensis]|uniref:F-box/WD repeat-containing protein 8-like n=1 Tax=Liolophura sinensis TaxID=3198878 RepID=UPI0031582042
MASGDELENFRKQWERELKHSRRRNYAISQKSNSDNKPDIAREDELRVKDELIRNHHRIPIEILENNDSNSTENYHPFVIVDNLLKSGHHPSSTEKTKGNCYFNRENDDDGMVTTGNVPRPDTDLTNCLLSPESKRRKLSNPSQIAHVKDKSGEKVINKNQRLLDQLISDLDEITEIPFFDINLPRELALKIFHHLDFADLCRCSQVSKAWRSLAEDELLWYQVCHRLGEHKQMTEGGDWKSHARYCVTRRRQLLANWKSRVGSLQQFQYIKGGVLCHVSSSEGRLVAGYTNGQVKMWQLKSGEECVFQPSSTALVIDEAQEEGTLANLLISTATSDTLTAAGYSQGIVDVWQNDGSTQPIYTIPCTEGMSHLTLAPGQPLVLTAHGPYVRFDLGRGREVSCIKKVKHVRLLRCPEPYIPVWYKTVVATNNVVWVHRPGHSHDSMTEVHNITEAPITAMDVSPDTYQLAVGVSMLGGPQQSCKVKLYCLKSGRLLSTLKGHTYFISCINLHSSPANHLVTGCGDRKVRVYDLRCTSPAMTLAAHTHVVSQVQMDDWKVVSGGEDGLTCVWDQRMALKLWDWHNRHPVRYSQFEDSQLVVANIPVEKFPQTDQFETSLHKRYRGSIQLYDFLSDQSTQGVPENCLSNYDIAEGYDYNIRLTVPYDIV